MATELIYDISEGEIEIELKEFDLEVEDEEIVCEIIQQMRELEGIKEKKDLISELTKGHPRAFKIVEAIAIIYQVIIVSIETAMEMSLPEHRNN